MKSRNYGTCYAVIWRWLAPVRRFCQRWRSMNLGTTVDCGFVPALLACGKFLVARTLHSKKPSNSTFSISRTGPLGSIFESW